VLLLTTRSGRELLIRIAEDADVEELPEEDTTGDDESEVTDLMPRIQRPRSATKAPALRKAANV
jgi:hypothetical protein